MDKVKFYDTIRSNINLTTDNVVGFNKVLNYGAARGTPTNFFAYILATAFWETSQTLRPVREAYWLSEEWRRKHLRYYPFYGRGLVQTTWPNGYRRAATDQGFSTEFFVQKPDLLLEWQYALPALFVSMEKGSYTTKKLGDFIDDIDESDDEDLREYINARRVVNGTDKAATIGRLALVFERGLRAAGYSPSLSAGSPATDIVDPVATPPGGAPRDPDDVPKDVPWYVHIVQLIQKLIQVFFRKGK